MTSATADRRAYQALFDGLVTRYVQCVCGRVLNGAIGIRGLRLAGWTFTLGISTLKWRCPDCDGAE